MNTEQDEAAYQEKLMQIQASLDAQETITINAAIGAAGPNGTKRGSDPLWRPELDIVAWRIPEGPIQMGDLLFDQRISDAELEALREAVVRESIVAFSAKLCEYSHLGDTRARFLGILPAPRDDKLAAILHEYCNPVVHEDPLLGRLILDKGADGYDGTIQWLGHNVSIHVSLDDSGELEPALFTAKALLSDQARWTRKVNAYAVDKLLPLKNDGWLVEDEAPVTSQQFIERMRFDSLSVYPDGSFSFMHLDGDLFFGHYIYIGGSLDEGLTDADIPG